MTDKTPECPNCKTRMELVHTGLSPTNSFLRNFECPTCHEKLLSAEAFDPMQSDVVNWLMGGFRTPK
jgi:hypothetical protein